MFQSKVQYGTISSKYNIDFPLIFAAFALVVIGILFIYSAGQEDSDLVFYKQPYIKQIFFLIPGVMLFAFSFMSLNYQKIGNLWLALYIIALVMLALVLVIGKEINSAKSWFIIGPISFQPSEPAKILIIFVLARFIEKMGKNINVLVNFLIAFIIPLPIIGLIMAQPDPGTALVYIPITIVMLLVGGARILHLSVLVSIGIITLFFTLYPSYELIESDRNLKNDKIATMVKSSPYMALSLNQDDINHLKSIKLKKIEDVTVHYKEYLKKISYIKKQEIYLTLKISAFLVLITIILYFAFKFTRISLLQLLFLGFMVLSAGLSISALGQSQIKRHHAARLLVVLNLDKDPGGVGYHQRQSKIALGSGGTLGHGLTEGPQNRLKFIPEKTNDFIFAVVGEEWGFAGTIAVFGLFSVLIYRGLMIAYNSKDLYGTLLAAGITTMFFSHFVINIGMAIGVLPVMGLPLPFLSAGGTSLITNLIGVGLLLNIAQRRYVH